MPSTRREALLLSAAGLLGLAGCGGANSETSSPTAAEPTYSRTVEEPESVTIRNTDGVPALGSTAETVGWPTETPPSIGASEHWLIRNPAEREALAFRFGTEDVEQAKEFLAATDLSTATVFCHQYAIQSCRTRRLAKLQWGTTSCGDVQCNSIFLQYDTDDRPDDCTNDEGSPKESEATLIRIPAEIDSFGSFAFQT